MTASLALALLSCGGEPAPLSPSAPLKASSTTSTVPGLTAPWDTLAGARWLRPDVPEQVLTIPDQPHGEDDVDDQGRATLSSTLRTRTFLFATTAEGLRQGAPSREDGPLIVALGDGATFGWGVPADEAWPARLAATANVRVLNVGVPGAQPRDLAAWCEQAGSALDIAVLVWSVHPHPNDPPPFSGWSSSQARCARATGAALLIAPPAVSSLDLAHRRTGATARDLLRTRTEAAGHTFLDLDAHLASLPGPRLSRRGGALVFNAPGEEPLARAPEQGETLPSSLLQAFAADSRLREPGFIDQRHPDALGHATIAAAMATSLPSLLAPETP